MKKIFSVFIAVIMLFSFAAGAEDIIDDMYQDDGYMEDEYIEDEYIEDEYIEDEFVPDNMYSEDELHNGNYVDYDNNNSFGYIEEVTANSTSSKVIIDGKEVQFEAYNIDYNNYFKLRDIAMALINSNKKFNVLWNAEYEMVEMYTNTPYTPVGGELLIGDGSDKKATNGTSDILKDGVRVNAKAYMINNNNYFKLRDIGVIMDFEVDWDEGNNCILINTNNSYAQ